ncbi:hypothetical protein [Promicromonospora sukumoe]|uniref:hypothetical protein n=1 Tax=Promicromonospora sukumoe TaxID=88382 RepID=UPI00036195F6|nr:hypothetical protein [Promicromonospora sukumoe]
MSIDDTDVLARLRAGADQVERHEFDAGQVVAGSRRALRRRRTWQALGSGATAVAVAFSLALVGPVPVPGGGEVTMPGSERVRELFGLAEGSECTAPEPAARRSPVDSGTNLRPGVTFDLARARPMSTCSDVRIDGAVGGTSLSPESLTEEGAFWKPPEDAVDTAGTTGTSVARVDPFIDGIEQVMAPTVLTPADDELHTLGGLTPQGDEAAWFEITTQSADQPPDRIVLVAGGRRIDSSNEEFRKSRAISEIEGDYDDKVAVTAQRVAWRQEALGGSTDSAAATDSWGLPAWVADIESGGPQLLAERATAIGGDGDEIVVATLDQPVTGAWSTTFTSFRDDGTESTVLVLEHPRETYVPLVDMTDDVLTYALDGGYHLAVVPRVGGIAEPDADQAVAVRLGGAGVSSLSASGDAVAWVSGEVAYLLRDAGPGDRSVPDLVRIVQGGLRKHVMIQLAGDRIAWSTTARDYRRGMTDEPEGSLTIGTLLSRDGPALSGPADPGSNAHAVPAAPTVTVPEDAVFHTYD